MNVHIAFMYVKVISAPAYRLGLASANLVNHDMCVWKSDLPLGGDRITRSFPHCIGLKSAFDRDGKVSGTDNDGRSHGLWISRWGRVVDV